MTLREFININEVAADKEKLAKDIASLKKPKSIKGVTTPDSINDLTMGQLIMLQEISNEKEYLFVPSRVILGIDEYELLTVQAHEVIGFSNWVAKEVERVGKLFKKANVPPTSEELQAGADRMNFGVFGLLDYYARRMGITDHSEVENVPWVRIYKCLDIDSKNIIFNRRLRKILMKAKK